MIQRGDIFFIDLDPVVGREQAGRRPVVVVSTNALNRLPLVVDVVPGTSRKRAPTPSLWNVLVSAGTDGLTQDTVFLTFQVRAIDHTRFRDRAVGSLPPVVMSQLEEALARTLELNLKPIT